MIKSVSRILKKKYILIVVAFSLAFGIVGTMYNLFVKNMQKGMLIEFNYPGSEKGLNPDGSIFDMSEMKSYDIVKKAKENMGYKNIDTEFLRSRIFITTKANDRSVDQVVTAAQSEKNIVYMPTTFYIYFTQKDKFRKNESRVFMENLANVYSEYFKEKYSEKNNVLEFKAADYDFSDIDYIEIHQILKDKVDKMLYYLKFHQSENRAFRSEMGSNIGMVAKKLESFSDTSLEKFYAFIIQNGISKDNSEYLKELAYLLEENEVNYEKSIQSSDSEIGTVSKYDLGITATAYVPSVDSKHNYYMSRTKTGIDELTRQSYFSGMNASTTLKQIEQYNNLVDKFSAMEETSDDKKAVAEKMIKELTSTLEDLSAEIVKTDDEYLDYKTMNYFNIRLPKDDSLNLIMIAAFMVIGFLIALATVIFLEFFKKGFDNKMKVIGNAFAVADYVDKNRGEKQ